MNPVEKYIKHQIYLKGEDKTYSVRSFKRIGNKFEVIFNSGKKFTYNASNVQIIESALSSQKSRNRFDYLKSIAHAVGLSVEVTKGKVINILSNNYSKIGFVFPDSVLAAFLDGELSRRGLGRDSIVLDTVYPFGFNASQKNAIDKALSNQLSIIEGPPGTGKTQTILNIIANIVMRGESVAVVSSNNSAIQNIVDKLKKYDIDFIAAALGNTTNRNNFIELQKPLPTLSGWELPSWDIRSLEAKLKIIHNTLLEGLSQQNQLSILKQELSAVQIEQKHFLQYFDSFESSPDIPALRKANTSKNALRMWLLCETIKLPQSGTGLINFIKRIYNYLRNLSSWKRTARKLLSQHPRNFLIAAFQRRFYQLKIAELTSTTSTIEQNLKSFNFDSKMTEHSDISMQLFRARLANKYQEGERNIFELQDLKKDSESFIEEYPVILSTTYSLRSSLSSNTMYDYLIIDESSQVDLCTGALALSCARRAVVAGDLHQLAHVVDYKTSQTTDSIFNQYDLPEAYRYKNHSLLSTLTSMFPEAPHTLLREHYRCHPKIIEFCNKKFYDDQLIILTKSESNREPLLVYKTTEGNHERSRVNQRQIDVIKNEIIPQRNLSTTNGSLGIVTPYRNQTNVLQKTFADMEVKADTVDKFQGQECPVIILSTVDNKISEFTDNANRLNVAISRAVEQLIVVVSHGDAIKDTNIGDLVRYIEYNNFTVVDSKVHSVFDYLYKSYAERRSEFLAKQKRVSEFDSENLMYALITSVLKEKKFKGFKVAVHVPLKMIVHDLTLMNPSEIQYATHPNTHVDFLLFDSIAKSPQLIIEVDGVAFHQEGSRQAERDAMKNEILCKYGLPIMRLKTDGSGERGQIVEMLDSILGN
jgi:hypothetical protein